MAKRLTSDEQWWYTTQYGKMLRRYFRDYNRIIKVLTTINPTGIDIPQCDPEMGHGLFIWGNLGYGKTILAALAFMEELKRFIVKQRRADKHWLDNDPMFIFTTTPQFIHELKNSYNGGEESERQIIDQYSTAELLVLDEFGLSKPSDWMIEMLYLIVTNRYNRMLPTIYTSNYDLPSIATILEDERITSRIDRSCKIIQKQPWYNPED